MPRGQQLQLPPWFPPSRGRQCRLFLNGCLERFGSRCRALHLLGSQLDQTRTDLSDLDLILLLEGEIGEEERREVRQLARESCRAEDPPLDCLPLGSKELSQGVPAYARAALRIWGSLDLAEAPLMPIREVAERWTRGSLRLLAALRGLDHLPEGALGLPDPAAPFHGYRLQEGDDPASTKRLVATLARMTGTWLVRDLGIRATSKHDCIERFTRLFQGPRGIAVERLYRRLKLDWGYRIPEAPSERQELSELLLEFHTLEAAFVRETS